MDHHNGRVVYCKKMVSVTESHPLPVDFHRELIHQLHRILTRLNDAICCRNQ